MSEPTAPSSTAEGTRARAQERPGRCRAPKVDTGRPCRREAGAGTEHWGEGPCSDHDDGTWTGVVFADDDEARAAFLDAVKVAAEAGSVPGIRELIEPLGYRRTHVTRLLESDPDFESAYVEARGYDNDSIRNELVKHRRAGSVPVLLFEARMRLPEAAVLRQNSTRFDGQLDVRGVPYLDMSAVSASSISAERRQALAACESELEALALVVGWVNPAADDLPRDGRPALELVAGSGNGAT